MALTSRPDVPTDKGAFAIRHNVLVTPHELIALENVLSAQAVIDRPVSMLSRVLAVSIAMGAAVAAIQSRQPMSYLMVIVLILNIGSVLRREARIELITAEGTVLADTLKTDVFAWLTASRTLDTRAEELAAWINEAVGTGTK